MCVVSMVADHWRDKWTGPYITPSPEPNLDWVFKKPAQEEELEALRADVEELKELLKRAKRYDEENGEPDCEMDEKVELIKKVAELVGVDLQDVFNQG